MKILKAKSISQGYQQALKLVESWSSLDMPSYCWFRGVNDNSLLLHPGALWRNGYDEYEAMLCFIQEGVSFANVQSLASWETYYLAQHHGMPTRLLDWTESFGAAMFFALDGVKQGKTPCVWVMQPEHINQRYFNWAGIMAPEYSEVLKPWLPVGVREHKVESKDSYSYDNNHPIAIYAKKSNTRIVAQQGSFTIHGRDARPLCQMIREDFEKPDRTLARIDFEGIDLDEARAHLAILGIRRSSIYPDIDNFVKQLGEMYWPPPKEGKEKKVTKRQGTKTSLKTMSRPIVKKAAKKVAKKAAKKAAKR